MARALPPGVAAALVFGSSGAVLVLEILAVRLLAPYVGLTLETYTTIIGVVLGGIAAGSALGGRAADGTDPRRLLAGLLIAGGLLAIATVPLVRALGDAAEEATAGTAALFVALIAFLPPAAVLSAVTPAVAKLQLGDLEQTGAVVGRLSAWATAGALTGTFATGFILVPLLPTGTTVTVLGAALVLAGIAAALRLGSLTASAALAAVAGAAFLSGSGALLGSRCDSESVYFCAQVDRDPDRATGRILRLDDLRHSYVDLGDPRHLEFDYARWVGDVIEARRPRDAVWIGGGGFTLPRYLAAVVPGATSTVLEVDEQLVELVRSELGLRTTDALRVRTGDARRTLRTLPSSSADLLVGDAFGGQAVPWHLTTRELVADIRRVLRPAGVYAVNVIDSGDLKFARAIAATLNDAFAHTAYVDDEPAGGNIVLLAGDRPLRLERVRFGRAARLRNRETTEIFARDAPVLTDDDAPADQLLTPTG